MKRELSKEEVEAQIQEQEARISRRADAIKDEVTLLEASARTRAGRLTQQAKDNALPIGGAALGAGVLLRLLFGGRSQHVPDFSEAVQRRLTDDYVAALAASMEARLEAGEPLRKALQAELSRRAPVLLRQASDRSGGSGWGWLLGLGLLAAAGAGLDYALRQLTGQGVMGWVQGEASDASSDVPAHTHHPAYADVHGTAGATMPTPDAPTPDAPAPDTPATSSADRPPAEPGSSKLGNISVGTPSSETASGASSEEKQ